ncbi:protein MAIN-LIKE 1-like [Arachis hypogaea]|uniref:protein MAIN-LIKE 1-like n=1 Tax=Arachis hypogaea TaxID=3818 RepID=UPI003B216226
MLTYDYSIPLDRYNERVEEHLRSTDFYHVVQIRVVQYQKTLVNALVERWHPDTHTFHLPVSEYAVILEDVAMILGLPTDGLPVTGMTLSGFEVLEAEFGTILFGDKSGASVHWKFLPLLRDFASIRQYNWGSACLAHLYRVLCRASHFDCKKIDGLLTLLLSWAWIRLPLAVETCQARPESNCVNKISHIRRNWEHGDRVYRYLKLAHFRKALDDLQESQFVWVVYAVDRIDPDIIPADIYVHSIVWSATVSLVSFECIEWHATDKFRRQFGFVQGVLHQERNLDKDNHLNLSDLVVQEDVEGNQVMDDENQEHKAQSPPPPLPPLSLPPQEQP